MRLSGLLELCALTLAATLPLLTTGCIGSEESEAEIASPDLEVTAAGGQVLGTYSLVEVGQGGPGGAFVGGGAIRADGTLTGTLAFSRDGGELIFLLHPTGWFWIAENEFIALCFEPEAIKGEPIISGCLGVPVTGGPVFIDFPDGDRVMLRVNLSGPG